MTRIALFPLNTVVFPGGEIELRIFEPRYLRMVSDCLSRSEPFGLCLIRKGSEVGAAAQPFRVGTLARIVDWEQRRDGLLGITARGECRFIASKPEINAMQLLTAEVELLDEPPPIAIPEQFAPLRELLRRILEQLPAPPKSEPQYDDACWVGGRLAEILPLPLRDKQRLLEIDDPLERLLRLQQLLQPEP